MLEADSSLRSATEEEIRRDFEQFEVGAIPPFGPLHGIPRVVDSALLQHDRVLCSAGDHRHGVLIDPNVMVGLAEARVADLCAD